MTNEIYRLTLEHYFDDGENRHKIGEPIVVNSTHDRSSRVYLLESYALHDEKRIVENEGKG